MNNKKFAVATLGCRTNQYETQAYIYQLEAMGYEKVEEGADICIVNTCTVTESADVSSKAQIRQLHKKHPEAQIVVTGCLAEKANDDLVKMPGVAHVVFNKDKEKLLNIVKPDELIPEFKIEEFDGHTRAFVKVQDGCNSFCSYCIIPYVRGRSRSRSLSEILEEVKGLIAKGYKEIVLTGINIGDFDGGDGSCRLSDLVKACDAIEGLKRLRVSSIDPDEVDEDLKNAIVYGKNTAKSMHIVLQAGSNAILKKMNRKYTKQEFFASCEFLKSHHPDFTFTTDIIVGFPGETEEDFNETLEVMEKIEFAKVHMFPYSPRPRTKAYLFPNRVDPKIIHERKQILLRKAEEIAFSLRNKFLNKPLKVLIETYDQELDAFFGHSDEFLPVYVKASSLKSNDLVDCKAYENTPMGLIARL
jgi:threonylcarbamoyladenosine tRNA methylthiotransferase MtaB